MPIFAQKMPIIDFLLDGTSEIQILYPLFFYAVIEIFICWLKLAE
jgi:hypothetical protein